MTTAARLLRATAVTSLAFVKALLTLAAVAALGVALVAVMYLLWDKTPEASLYCVDAVERASDFEDARHREQDCVEL